MELFGTEFFSGFSNALLCFCGVTLRGLWSDCGVSVVFAIRGIRGALEFASGSGKMGLDWKLGRIC
jgi:hypothetical protein